MVGKGVFLTRKETRARLGRIEVGGEENSKWMERQMKKSIGRLRPNIRDCEEEFVSKLLHSKLLGIIARIWIYSDVLFVCVLPGGQSDSGDEESDERRVEGHHDQLLVHCGSRPQPSSLRCLLFTLLTTAQPSELSSVQALDTTLLLGP